MYSGFWVIIVRSNRITICKDAKTRIEFLIAFTNLLLSILHVISAWLLGQYILTNTLFKDYTGYPKHDH